MQSSTSLTRIGVFYDGGYLQAVSDYYKYSHNRQARLNLQGFPSFIEQQIALAEDVDVRRCHVVDAHYFRGRFATENAIESGHLEDERRWDEVLMRAGIVTHYLPRDLNMKEKGIDVWFALEAFEQAVYKRFDVLALVACDGDYVPLVRKLHTLGTRVMLLAWDFRWTDETKKQRVTRTAQTLIEEVTYPVTMHTLIDDRALRDDPFIKGLFLSEKKTPYCDDNVRQDVRGTLPSSPLRGTDSAAKDVGVQDSASVGRSVDEVSFERVIREVDSQGRRREFVWIGYLAKTAIPAALGLSEAESHALVQRMVDAGVISTSKRPNPKNPEFPTTVVALNREHPAVQQALANGPSAGFFEPVPIRGEPASATLMRERR